MPYKYSETSRMNQYFSVTFYVTWLQDNLLFFFLIVVFFFFFFFKPNKRNTLRTLEDLRTIWNSSSLTRTTNLLNSPLVFFVLFFLSLPSTLKTDRNAQEVEIHLDDLLVDFILLSCFFIKTTGVWLMVLIRLHRIQDITQKTSSFCILMD